MRKKGRYDERLDRKLFSRTWEHGVWKIIIGVYSYKGEKAKLDIRREKSGQKYEGRPYRLGRLSKDELTGILPIIQEALHHMK